MSISRLGHRKPFWEELLTLSVRCRIANCRFRLQNLLTNIWSLRLCRFLHECGLTESLKLGSLLLIRWCLSEWARENWCLEMPKLVRLLFVFRQLFLRPDAARSAFTFAAAKKNRILSL